MVNHRLLGANLRVYDIANNECVWINEFLRDRTFVVRVRESTSAHRLACSGVPQGSVLGPLLFLVFINDVTKDVDSPCWLFADDLKLMSAGSAIEGVQQDVHALGVWANAWDLPFNAKKCQHLALVCPENPLQIVDEQNAPHDIAHCRVVRDLGVQISADFKPALQCAAAAAKVR